MSKQVCPCTPAQGSRCILPAPFSLQLIGIPDELPCNTSVSLEGSINILQAKIDLVKPSRGIIKQRALFFPSWKVLRGLQSDCINIDVVISELLVDVAIKIFR